MNGSTSRILAFDPGEQTGIALIEDGDWVWGMTCKEIAFQRYEFILALTSMSKPTLIVIETPPTQTPHFNQAQTNVFTLVKSYYEVAGYTVQCLTPGNWKKLVPRSKISSDHMKDAVDMAVLQFRKELKK
jgi:hypothetical protein